MARARGTSGRRPTVSMGIGAIAAAFLLLWHPGCDRSAGTPDRSPIPPTSRRPDAGSGVTRSDILGAKACAGCHREQYDKWRQSTHGRAGGKPGRVRVLAPFDGTPIRFRDAVVIPRSSEGVFTFTVRREGRPDQVLRVDGVVGGGHMIGGGTQGFFSRFPDGTYRFLPWDFIRDEGTWFCATRPDGHWMPIEAEMPLAHCGDWPPNRVLGETSRFANCESCHGSQVDIRLDPKRRRYDTRFTALHINCESCHGAGRRHVELVKDPKAVASGDIGMRSLATVSKDESLRVCWSCHTIKDAMRTGYLSGKNLWAYYAQLLPQLDEEEPHTPDGRITGFAYQGAHLWSDCYVNGGMTCVSCHDPHSQGYRDVNGVALQGWSDDRQCTSCHASKAQNPRAHTHHPPPSAGARCVSCHMPFIPQRSLGDALRYTRSDHTIPIPRPEFDASLGLVGACRGCHEDRTPKQLGKQVARWYGRSKPHPRAVRAAQQLAKTRDPVAAARLVLRADEKHAAALFIGLAKFARRFLKVDMPSLAPEIVRRLQALTAHPNIDVRSAAIASLDFARGRQPAVRRFLADRLRAEGKGAALVRMRWAASLLYFAEWASRRGDLASAITTGHKIVEVQPRNARYLRQLGEAYARKGLLAEAVAHYRRSLALDSNLPLTFVALGQVLALQRRPAEAARALRRALSLNPREPAAHRHLGDLLFEDGHLEGAVQRYRKAVELNPALAEVQFQLAIAYAQLGEPLRAVRALEAGLDREPEDKQALAMHRDLVKELEDLRHNDNR